MKRAEGTPSSLEETEYGLSATPDLPQPVFNAYFGIGSDALITLKFHNKREANPGAFKSRFMNKMKYGLQGAGVVLGRQTKKLTDGMTLVCDGKDYTSFIREKKLGAITFLNVNNYMVRTRTPKKNTTPPAISIIKEDIERTLMGCYLCPIALTCTFLI